MTGKTNVTPLRPRPQRPRALTITVGQYQALMAAIELLPARIAAEFQMQGLVPPRCDVLPFEPQWADDETPF